MTSLSSSSGSGGTTSNLPMFNTGVGRNQARVSLRPSFIHMLLTLVVVGMFVMVISYNGDGLKARFYQKSTNWGKSSGENNSDEDIDNEWESEQNDGKVKMCPERMLREELLQQETEPVVIPKNTTEKFVTLIFNGGLNNCLIAIERAAVVAASTGRTLLIPYLESDHVKEGPGTQKSIYEEKKYHVSRKGAEGMQFQRIKYKSYSRDKEEDIEAMKKMSFRTYFRLKQLTHPDLRFRFANGLSDWDDYTPGVKQVNVAFIEDNPEFWASKTWFCPEFKTKSSTTKDPFFNQPEFNFANDNDQFLCLGQSFLYSQQMPDGYDPSQAHMRGVEFSPVLNKVANAVLDIAGLKKGKFMGLHNRRGDFKDYCREIAEKKGQDVLEHCYPSYKHIMEVIKEFVSRKEVVKQLILETDPATHVPKPYIYEGVKIPDTFPIFVATNENDPEIISELERDAGWIFLDTVCYGTEDEGCKDAAAYPFLRPALDAAILYQSGGLIFNNYSTLSRRLIALRRLWTPPGLETRV